jgi:hypothetical protein
MLSPLLVQTAHAWTDDNNDAEVTFTKWVTGVTATAPGQPADPGQSIILMAGFTGGDAPGVFAGEVLYRKVSANGRITQLWPIYQVTARERSFTALIQGGTNGTGVGILDGVIMEGWRAGDRVQVNFQTRTTCAGTAASPCFQGTIRISRDKNRDKDRDEHRD